jgi:hypothetical protein
LFRKGLDVPPPEWMATLSKESVSAEKYDRMPEEICRRIEVVDGRVIMSPAASPRHNRIARMLANAVEEAAPAPWQVTGVDLRISDRPLAHFGALTAEAPFPVTVDLDAPG